MDTDFTPLPYSITSTSIKRCFFSGKMIHEDTNFTLQIIINADLGCKLQNNLAGVW